MDIFEEQRLYPKEDDTILGNFAGFYDSVFIAYLPFFRLANTESRTYSVQKSHEVSWEQLKSEEKIFVNIPPFNAKIFSYENDEYPEDVDILDNAEAESWENVIKGADLNDYSELNKALRTSIGSYRPIFERTDLVDRLYAFTEKERIFHPTEGGFDVLSKVEIYNTLKLLGKREIIVIDEFYLSEKELDIEMISSKEFVEKIEYKDYFIYPKDKSILFAIDWDSFFYLICSDRKSADTILENSSIEGFFCNNETKHGWEWNEEEFLELLKSETYNEKKSLLTKFMEFFTNN